MLTSEELNNISYVVVEVSRKATREFLVGYFKGLILMDKSVTDLMELKSEYVLLQNEDTLYMLRFEDFNIMTISIGIETKDKNGSTTITKRSFNLTSSASLKLLDQIRKHFVSTKKATEEGVITVDNFKVEANSYLEIALKRYDRLKYELPEIVSKNDTKKTNGFIKNESTTVTTHKKEIVTTIIKRTTRYNKEKAIKKLKDKIIKMQSNQYNVVLPNDDVNVNTDKDNRGSHQNPVYNESEYMHEEFGPEMFELFYYN